MAEDITQQVFFELWKKRTSLPAVESPEAWLWTVCRNHALKRLKKEAKRREYAEYIKDLFREDTATPVHQLIIKQKGERIEKLLARLSPRQQEIYRLNKHAGMTYSGIAAQLGLSKETVKEHMSNALKVLRTLLIDFKDELLLLIFICMGKK